MKWAQTGRGPAQDGRIAARESPSRAERSERLFATPAAVKIVPMSDTGLSSAGTRRGHSLLVGGSVFTAAAILTLLVEKTARHELFRELSRLGVFVGTARAAPTEMSWSTVAALNVWFWGAWALATPLIMVAARRAVGSLPRRAAVWTGIGVVSCTMHVTITDLLRVGPTGLLSLSLPAEPLLGFRSPAGVQLTLVSVALIAVGVQALMYFQDLEQRQLRESARRSDT